MSLAHCRRNVLPGSRFNKLDHRSNMLSWWGKNTGGCWDGKPELWGLKCKYQSPWTACTLSWGTVRCSSKSIGSSYLHAGWFAMLLGGKVILCMLPGRSLIGKDPPVRNTEDSEWVSTLKSSNIRNKHDFVPNTTPTLVSVCCSFGFLEWPLCHEMFISKGCAVCI